MKPPRILLALLALSLASVPAQADSGKDPVALAQQDRAVPGGRVVRQILSQNEILTSVDVGRVSDSAAGGGLLGALIIGDMDRDRRASMAGNLSRRAEATVVPLRAALAGFDVEALVQETTRKGFGALDWFGMRDPVATGSASEIETDAFVAASPTPQTASIRYRYELSPDFSQIRVLAEIVILKRTKARPQVVFRQRLCSVVQLRVRAYEADANVASWSADGGARARTALTAAFGEIAQLIPRALALDAPGIDALDAKAHEKAFAAGFYGSLLARDPSDPENILIWTKGLLHVQSIS